MLWLFRVAQKLPSLFKREHFFLTMNHGMTVWTNRNQVFEGIHRLFAIAVGDLVPVMVDVYKPSANLSIKHLEIHATDLAISSEVLNTCLSRVAISLDSFHPNRNSGTLLELRRYRIQGIRMCRLTSGKKNREVSTFYEGLREGICVILCRVVRGEAVLFQKSVYRLLNGSIVEFIKSIDQHAKIGVSNPVLGLAFKRLVANEFFIQVQNLKVSSICPPSSYSGFNYVSDLEQSRERVSRHQRRALFRSNRVIVKRAETRIG